MSGMTPSDPPRAWFDAVAGVLAAANGLGVLPPRRRRRPFQSVAAVGTPFSPAAVAAAGSSPSGGSSSHSTSVASASMVIGGGAGVAGYWPGW